MFPSLETLSGNNFMVNAILGLHVFMMKVSIRTMLDRLDNQSECESKHRNRSRHQFHFSKLHCGRHEQWHCHFSLCQVESSRFQLGVAATSTGAVFNYIIPPCRPFSWMTSLIQYRNTGMHLISTRRGSTINIRPTRRTYFHYDDMLVVLRAQQGNTTKRRSAPPNTLHYQRWR